MTEYSAETCITAGELREMGLAIPDTIPDCGWVPRSSLVISSSGVRSSGDKIICDMRVDFTRPFQWINLTVEVPSGDEGDDDR